MPTMCLPSPLFRGMPAAELEETVTILEQSLATTQRRVSEVQQMADAAQKQAGAAQGLTQEIEQLRSALQVKDMELASVKVRRRVSPCVQCLQRNTCGMSMVSR